MKSQYKGYEKNICILERVSIMFITKKGENMVANVFLNRKDEYKISKEFIIYLRMLSNLNYLRSKNLITDNDYLYAKVQLKKLHNSI